jgi:hypothetical protein
MRLSLGGLFVSGALLFSQSTAWAADTKTPFPSCTTTPTEADRKAAQGAFAAGQGSFNEADYSTAITYWRDAYKRDCTAHALLLNLARAYELRGDRGEAVNALESYLQRKPDDSNAEQIRRRIENLKAQSAAAAAPPPPTVPSVSAPPAAPPPLASTPSSSDVPSGPRRQVVGPAIVGAAGLVVTVVGVASYAAGTKKVSDAEKVCPNHECPASQVTNHDLGNEGTKQQTTGGVLMGLGLATIAGGVVWFILSGRLDNTASAASDRRPTLIPTYLPGFAGAALSGSF